jgi:nucleoside-diphosphate-sugar epimerase
MRKILITGGAGFVGRHFARHFLDAGDDVIVVDPIAKYTGGVDPSVGWPLFDPRDYDHFTFLQEDCRAFFSRTDDSDFDYVLHLAAMVGGRLMIEYNPIVVADDLSIDAAYWQWATRTKPRRTVSFSSSAAYPIKFQRETGHVLLREDMIDFGDDIGMPDLSYGWAKLTCEYLGRLAFERYGLKSVVYRPFSGYGEDQDDTYPFPSICKRALLHRGASEIAVWGSGTQMRDFIHIDDCVRGVITTMDRIDNGDALNLSTGILTSFLDFAALAADVCGYKPVVRGMSDKPSGVHARGGDTKKQKAYGFTATIPFNEGIRGAIAYLGANH